MPSNREMRRTLQKMGVEVKEVPNVKLVKIITDSSEIIITEPSVSQVSMQGIVTFEITGGKIEAKQGSININEAEIKEEDVMLVAAQSGASKEEALKSLKESNGDIALAILKLQERKRFT
ncbi:MAG: nascent polypeptide-associated complex protein [Conexivisphaerales archaeon]